MLNFTFDKLETSHVDPFKVKVFKILHEFFFLRK